MGDGARAAARGVVRALERRGHDPGLQLLPECVDPVARAGARHPRIAKLRLWVARRLFLLANAALPASSRSALKERPERG